MSRWVLRTNEEKSPSWMGRRLRSQEWRIGVICTSGSERELVIQLDELGRVPLMKRQVELEAAGTKMLRFGLGAMRMGRISRLNKDIEDGEAKRKRERPKSRFVYGLREDVKRRGRDKWSEARYPGLIMSTCYGVNSNHMKYSLGVRIHFGHEMQVWSYL